MTKPNLFYGYTIQLAAMGALDKLADALEEIIIQKIVVEYGDRGIITPDISPYDIDRYGEYILAFAKSLKMPRTLRIELTHPQLKVNS